VCSHSSRDGGDAPEPDPPSVAGAIRVRPRFGGALVGNEARRRDSPPTQEPDSPLQIRFLRAVELIAAPLEMLAARLPSSSAANPSGTTCITGDMG
jgi:hypothetical protein